MHHVNDVAPVRFLPLFFNADMGNYNDALPKQPAPCTLDVVPELAAKLQLPGHKF